MGPVPGMDVLETKILCYLQDTYVKEEVGLPNYKVKLSHSSIDHYSLKF